MHVPLRSRRRLGILARREALLRAVWVPIVAGGTDIGHPCVWWTFEVSRLTIHGGDPEPSKWWLLPLVVILVVLGLVVWKWMSR